MTSQRRMTNHPHSGLGPKAHLEEKGVSVVQDMPAVGSYLVRYYPPRCLTEQGLIWHA